MDAIMTESSSTLANVLLVQRNEIKQEINWYRHKTAATKLVQIRKKVPVEQQQSNKKW